MNDNDAYIVQCNCENFDDAQYLVKVFCRILAVDTKNFSIKTCALDSTIKKRLDEIGASFWQEPEYALNKPGAGRGV